MIQGPVVNLSNGHSYVLLESISSSSDLNPFHASRTAGAFSLEGDLVTIDDTSEDEWVYPMDVTALLSEQYRTMEISRLEEADDGSNSVPLCLLYLYFI